MCLGNCAGAALWRSGFLCFQSRPGIVVFTFAIALLGVDGGTLFRSPNRFREKILSFPRPRPAVSSTGDDCVDDLCDRRNSIALLRGTDTGAADSCSRAGLDILAKRRFGRAGLAALCGCVLVFSGDI